MRVLRTFAEQPVGLVLGFAVASILFLAAFGLALTTGRVLATHDATGNVHACVSLYTGQARVMFPGQPPNCTVSERLVEWPGTALAADIAELEARLEELACIQSAPGANPAIDDIVFTDCNVQVVSGAGSTSAAPNGTGNLIVGYNENVFDRNRSGSHNLVVGSSHGYSSYGGLVVGEAGLITGAYASVSGGFANTASGDHSSVSGGFANTASGPQSSASGGERNEASGEQSSVSGGGNSVANGDTSSISGGNSNRATGGHSSVSGGSGNFATGGSSSVSGGENNTASGDQSSVSGGLFRTTNNMDPTHDWRGGSLNEDD